jgi:cytochrome c oxidase subunit 2
VIPPLLPLAASEHAADFDAVLVSVHVHIFIQAIAWGAFFVYCVSRFRERAGRDTPSPPPLKPWLPGLAIALVIIGDAVLLATAALPAWLKHASLPDADNIALEVRVVAEQYAWNIHYPGPDRTFGPTSHTLMTATNPLGIDRRADAGRDDIGLLNILTVPLGRPVVVHLSSRDVVHSFTLNEMRIRHDATPGLTVRTWFTPTTTGRWDIACSQLCGLGHYRMRGTFSVVGREEWLAWEAREVALVRLSPR